MSVTDRRPPTRRVLVGLAVGLTAALVATVVALTVGPGQAATMATAHSGATARPAPTVVRSRGSGATPAAPSPAEEARTVARDFARLPDTGWIATLRRTTTWSVRPGAAPAGRLAARNPYGTPMVVAVVGAPRSDGWAEIERPVRPNGSTGWIRWHDVSLARTAYRVVVDLGARRLTVLDGTRQVLTTSVAVGASPTPTPTGSTYLWELVRPSVPGGAYGPYVFGLALYSDAYAMFNGGEAQIGLHGSDEPGLIGQAVSNGCIRLPNATVAQLTGLLPLGTPVTISA